MRKIIVKINNLNWKVYFVANNDANLDKNDDEDDVCGITHFSKLRIYINRDIDEELILHTLKHELTHATLFSYGMGQYETFTEENVCDIVETYGEEIINNANYIYNAYIKSRLD